MATVTGFDLPIDTRFREHASGQIDLHRFRQRQHLDHGAVDCRLLIILGSFDFSSRRR
jgi:hypothetical protein